MRVRLKEMCIHYGVSEAEMVRSAINEIYDGSYRKSKFGYQAGTETSSRRIKKDDKKESRDAQIESIKAMSHDEILAWLKEVGYPTDKPEGQIVASGATRRFILRDDGSGNVEFVELHINPDETIGYENPWFFSLDDLIKDVIKEKKI